jgi:phenylalanyl-tRNA synthetase beta chain
MYISLNWLTNYVDVDMPAAELGELFTRIGLNCEGINATGQDIVFDLEVTSNRPDCLGHLGVARELAVASGRELRQPKFTLPKGTGRIEDFLSVEVLSPQLCPRYTARLVRDVTVVPARNG